MTKLEKLAEAADNDWWRTEGITNPHNVNLAAELWNMYRDGTLVEVRRFKIAGVECSKIIDKTTANGGKWAFENAPTVEVGVVHIMEHGDVVALDTHLVPQVYNKFGVARFGGAQLIPLQRSEDFMQKYQTDEREG